MDFFCIKTADCVPVLVSAPEKKLFAAAHCGWRGTVAGLLPSLLQRILQLGAKPEEIALALGPSAGVCCYEISADVADEFISAAASLAPECAAKVPPKVIVESDSGLLRANIRALLFAQATALGLRSAQIQSYPHCTICDHEFFSFRRQKGNCSRQVSLIGAFR